MNVKPINSKPMIAVGADILGIAAEVAAVLWTLSSAPNAIPVLNMTNKPNTAPASGINIARQRPKLFRKIYGINVPLAVRAVTVWFKLSFICLAS